MTVTIPLTVMVAGQTGQPYDGLKVYAFDGSTYTGYHGTTDKNGQVILTLPEGSYRFRADYDGVPFWSGDENSCSLPGCTATNVTLPGGRGEETNVTIDYTYDGLYRLTAADYSDGRYYHYDYDAVGNRLSQAATVLGQPVSTSYEYDAANRLTGVDGIPYTWDANGNLLNDGKYAYAYDAGNRLASVSDGAGISSYLYNGLGDRLQQTVTTLSGASGVTTRYSLDIASNLSQVLNDGTNEYLYGLDRIVQMNGSSAGYFLTDGIGSVRQLKDMHVERDYLVKQDFPQLSEWYERRRLRLVNIDLRWEGTGNLPSISYKDVCHVRCIYFLFS